MRNFLSFESIILNMISIFQTFFFIILSFSRIYRLVKDSMNGNIYRFDYFGKLFRRRINSFQFSAISRQLKINHANFGKKQPHYAKDFLFFLHPCNHTSVMQTFAKHNHISTNVFYSSCTHPIIHQSFNHTSPMQFLI